MFSSILWAFCWWINRWFIWHIVVLGNELKVIKRFKTTNQKVPLSSKNRNLNRSSVVRTIHSCNTIYSIIKKWDSRIISDKVEILVTGSDISDCNGFWTKSLNKELSMKWMKRLVLKNSLQMNRYPMKNQDKLYFHNINDIFQHL